MGVGLLRYDEVRAGTDPIRARNCWLCDSFVDLRTFQIRARDYAKWKSKIQQKMPWPGRFSRNLHDTRFRPRWMSEPCQMPEIELIVDPALRSRIALGLAFAPAQYPENWLELGQCDC